MNDYPKEINDFQNKLASLAGIENVCSGIDRLETVNGTDLGFPDFSHLPIATLLRTNGGLPNEIMLQFEFAIDRSPESLNSVEFLSWFVRDQAKSGKKIQLRTFALPPQGPSGVQLGATLKFHIDYFLIEPSGNLQLILDRVSELSQSLDYGIRIYQVPTKNQTGQ